VKSRWRSELFWVLGLGVVMLLIVWWIPGAGGASRDTYSFEARGKSALFRLLAGTGFEPARSLAPLDETTLGRGSSVETLLLLGPSRYPSREEWSVLLRWLTAGGGTLVFAAREDDPAVRIPLLGIEVKPPGTPFQPSRRPTESEDGPEKEPPSPLALPRVETDLAAGKFLWRSSGKLDYDDPFHRVEVLVKVDGDPQVIRRKVGLGTLVVAASDWVFNNRSLADRRFDNGLLAFRLIEAAGPGRRVHFDESLNSLGTAKVVGILLDPELRQFTLQIVLVTLLFVWWGSRRFGPPRLSTAGRRRSIVEHAVALGNLHYKAGSGARLASYYWEYFQREAGRSEVRAREQRAGREGWIERTAARVARGAGLDANAVARIFQRAEQSRSRTDMTAGETFRLVRSLAEVKRVLGKG